MEGWDLERAGHASPLSPSMCGYGEARKKYENGRKSGRMEWRMRYSGGSGCCEIKEMRKMNDGDEGWGGYQEMKERKKNDTKKAFCGLVTKGEEWGSGGRGGMVKREEREERWRNKGKYVRWKKQ